MKKSLTIAIPLIKNRVSEDVEHCDLFLSYEIDRSRNRLIGIVMLESPPAGIENRIQWLYQRWVDILLYSGFNPEVNSLCMHYGITVVSGFQPAVPGQAISCFLRARAKIMSFETSCCRQPVIH